MKVSNLAAFHFISPERELNINTSCSLVCLVAALTSGVMFSKRRVNCDTVMINEMFMLLYTFMSPSPGGGGICVSVRPSAMLVSVMSQECL